MSKGVSKQCSILNYLRHTDEPLYELIQDLCLGKIFIPRKGSPGVTFLRPDKDLLKEIQEAAASDEPEKAVDMLQSLVLLDNISSIHEFDSKKSDIPTFLRKKLPVVSADGKKAVLKNGAEIVPDSKFHARKDRSNLSVYIISKALVPSDGPDADFSNAVRKEKKGGAELRGLTRAQLFENVLERMCNGKGDPALELLVALHGWANDQKENKDASDMAVLIESQASWDTIASLAIVLQPYKPGDDRSKYISDALLGAALSGIVTGNSDADETKMQAFLRSASFTRNPKPVDYYEGLVSSKNFGEIVTRVMSQLEVEHGRMARVNAVQVLEKAYQNLRREGLPALRAGVPPAQLFAEAELRILSALVQENNDGECDFYAMQALFQNCKLDQVYLCTRDQMQNSSVTNYYSTVLLMARSDAFLYVPGYPTDKTSNVVVTEPESFISLSATMEAINKKRRDQTDILANTVGKY